jgi:hypothetical protein
MSQDQLAPWSTSQSPTDVALDGQSFGSSWRWALFAVHKHLRSLPLLFMRLVWPSITGLFVVANLAFAFYLHRSSSKYIHINIQYKLSVFHTHGLCQYESCTEDQAVSFLRCSWNGSLVVKIKCRQVMCFALSCAAIICIVTYEIHLNNTSPHGVTMQVFVFLRIINATHYKSFRWLSYRTKKEDSCVLSSDKSPEYDF